MKNTYNIMTSSDENLIHQIEILVYSIGRNLSNADVNFYFFSRGIAEDKLEGINKIVRNFPNLVFQHVIVPNAEEYDYIASYGGMWAGEAYYSLAAHELLPDNIDRILYVDAGDIMILGDIADFYFDDFANHTLLASTIRLYKDGEPMIFKKSDISDPESFLMMLDSSFNSGSYMVNLKKMREDGRSIKDYLDVVELCKQIMGADNHQIYFGDQGFLNLFFAGEIKYFGYPMQKYLGITDYNFMMGWYNLQSVKPAFQPKVVHFVGGVKPWTVDYPIELQLFQSDEKIPVSSLTLGQAEWYYLWQEYALLTEKLVLR